VLGGTAPLLRDLVGAVLVQLPAIGVLAPLDFPGHLAGSRRGVDGLLVTITSVVCGLIAVWL
jgi:hypothetical protein